MITSKGATQWYGARYSAPRPRFNSLLCLFSFLAPKYEELHLRWAWRMTTGRDEAQREKTSWAWRMPTGRDEAQREKTSLAQRQGKNKLSFFLFLLPAGLIKY